MGNARAMICAKPESDETGVIMPANCVAGSTVSMAVPNSAAICVRANADITMPYAVVADTRERRDRCHHAGELHRWQYCQYGGAKQRGDLRPCKCRYHHAVRRCR